MSLSYWLASARWSVIEGTIPSLMSVSGLPVKAFCTNSAIQSVIDDSILLLIMLVEWKARTVRQMDMRMYWRRFK